MFIGSRLYPNRLSMPICHITATSEQVSGSTVSQTDREYKYSRVAVIKNATRKNQTTDWAPSDMSPTILANPMI